MINNIILKKLRIALDLQDADMFQIFELGGKTINKALLSGFFRKEGHKNYRECSDELLEIFLNGYIIYKRGDKDDTESESEIEVSSSANLYKSTKS